MNRITLYNVMPEVFKLQHEHSDSDIWQKDVTFERGNHYLIEADSGKGKSTFCSYLLGYRHDYTGQVLFDGKDAQTYGMKDWTTLRQRHISCLFQELRLFPELTAFENVEIKNKLTQHKTYRQIEEWFDALGITEKLNVKVGRLSFGQQQRVALMRALAQPFDFLLADEPISHLDDRNASAMADLVRQEAETQGASVIATSIGKRLPLNYNHTLQL